MQLTKTKEKEILKVYDTWMNAYLNADVATYDRYFDDSYHFIGSTLNEEYLNRKDTTDFFKVTGEQLSGMLDLRNESKILEQFGDYVFLTHICDTWFKNDEDWSYYGRFRLSSVLHQTKNGWKFIYQHFSLPDAKSEEGETIGFDKINAENQELREAIKRRTIELEAQKRELEIEGALGRIRAQATAMKTSTELLDIVVSMRNEFTKLGHEAHYFWHMMWLPNTYEKAMTSGDGTRIGFVMTLPRHIHGDIPVLANWEKSKDTTVVYAMNTEDAIDYVDKMVALGDFQNIDPQAPSHDDIRHIGGLTFIMARTTHGEIGYSLPGIVKNPPKEAVQILERFADAFDLAHRRFLDLQKAERQAREVEIELALEKVRSRTMAMQHSDELQEASFLLDEQVRGLGIKTWGCAFNIYGEKDSTEWFGNEAGVLPTYTVPRKGIFKDYYQKGQKGESLFIKEFSGKACVNHYEYMSALPVIGDVLKNLKKTNKGFPTYQIDHVVYFKYGYLLFITREHVPEAHDIFKRFAKVFEQTYTRFLDLQKAEAQAREAQIELGLERVRARAMAMQSTNELSDLVGNLLHELTKLDFSLTFCIINIINEGDKSNMVWAANPEEGKAPESYYMKFEDYPFHHAMMREWKAQTPKFIYVMEGEEKKIYDDYLYTDTEFRRFPKDVQTANRALDKYVSSFVFSKFGGLQTVGDQHLSDESLDILYRFGKVFDLTYTRFNDLQKAEEQAREAKVEAALERIRSRSLAMTKSEQLGEVILEIHKKFRELDISMESRVAIVVVLDSESKDFNQYTASNDVGNFYISTPYCEHPILDDFYAAKEAGVEFFSKAYTEEEKNSYFKHFFETSFTPYEIVGLEEQMQWVFDQKFYTHSQAFQKNSCIGMADYSGIPLNDFEIDTIKRFSKVFDQAYTRFLDLKKAEVQAREAQIEAALEKVRSRSLAMQKSDELEDVILEVLKKLQDLGISMKQRATAIFTFEDGNKDYEQWVASPEYKSILSFLTPYFDHPVQNDIWEARQNGTEFYSKSYSVEVKNSLFKYLFDLPALKNMPKAEKTKALEFEHYSISIAFQKHAALVVVDHSGVPLTEDENTIVLRLNKVFHQTYTRFLDLQKAETQAREAQIEVALERTRTQSMLMQHSDELKTTAQVFHEQLELLGIDSEFSYLWLPDEDEKNHMFWATWSEIQNKKIAFKNKVVTFPLDKSEPSIAACYVAWESEENIHVNVVKPDDVEDYFNTWADLLDGVDKFKPELFPEGLFYIDSYMSYGCFGIMTKRKLSDSEKIILSRFSKEFQRTYTRFLDLQKAEAQAREAQIEASLERVRSRTMAMHRTNELQDVIQTVHQELIKLEIGIHGGSFIAINHEIDKELQFWGSGGTAVTAKKFIMPYYDRPFYTDLFKGIKKGPGFFTESFSAKEKKEFFTFLFQHEPWSQLDKKEKDEVLSTPNGYVRSCCISKHTSMVIVNHFGRDFTEDENLILKRFARVFEQTYTRFLDLQKAEAQAREAQIVASLERVRAATMAMHQSKELSNVLSTLFEQYDILGITPSHAVLTLINKEKNTLTFRSTGKNGYKVYAEQEVDLNVYDSWLDTTEKWKKSKPNTVNVNEYPPEILPDIWEVYKDVLEAMPKKARPEIKDFPDGLFITEGYCQFGYIGFAHNRKPTEEEKDIVRRFATEFGSLYQRFLDLKKAEIQTREAQINLAVERVRAKALAMHKSEEIMEVVAKLKEEVMGLDIPAVVAASIFLEADDNYIRMWDLSALERSDKGYLAITDITFKLKKADPHLYIKRVWENNQNYFVETQDRKDLDRIIEFMYENNQLEIAKEVEDYTKSTNLQQLYHASKRLNNGKLCIDLLEQPPAEMEAILDKIGAAFDLAYQRFLDLQKAEAQTKESQIEAALEKVRSRSLAMQKPDELQEVVAIVAEKLKELGVIFDAGGVILCTYFPDNKDVVHWIAVPDFSSSGRYYVPYFDNPIFNDAWDSKIRGDAFFSQKFPVEVKNHFFEHTFKHSDYRDMPEDYKQHVLQAESHALSAAWSKNSAILIPSLTGVVPSENDAQIMQRFAKVFEQAYIRFMDLQQAEIREKEAIKQASLDRVRGEIASMRTTKDLERITPLIWKELTTLGVPFFRCGMFIIREDEKMVHAYLSKPDGTSVAAIHIPFSDTDNKLITPTIENWRLQQAYKETWDQDQFIQQTHLFLEKGQIENPDAYDISETPPEQLVLHLIPFKQGMVYVGNHEDLTEDQISLVESLSTAFSVAYSRYEDFKALETAKNSLELTINDLKSAQAQLIQAEKMASLGELTAGIAHEIQNPLNFVNNFSEVSEELIDEMNEELDNGDLEEAKAISKDLKDNLSKINHHGKRADAIVKGMLEHSRINKGEKKPTDINALLDEFVRLSYHGLRAKDKSFNADFKLNLDPNIPKVNVVSSDIGRVILNLVNNAFYACTERSRSACAERDRITLDRGIKTYNPEVIVSSKQTDQGIELSVKDNGGGIPEQVRDKIFQPFFTTKPTGKGTGLGLSLSYDIIKAHGGKLTLESSEGDGTLFSIQIPIQ